MIQPSLRSQSIPGSATLTIAAKAQALKAAGNDVISFSVGEPDFNTPPHIVEAATKAMADGMTRYTPTAGLPSLRKAVAEELSTLTRQTYSPSQVLVGSGAKHVLHNLLQALINPGDEVLVPAPYWVSYPPMIELAQGTMRVMKTTVDQGFRITAEQLKHTLSKKSRVLMLNTPSNPTGAAYSKGELAALGEVILSHPNLLVVCDEIYRKLVFDGFEHVSLASLSNELAARCFVVDGVSKTYAMTGWRVGYCVGDENIIKAATRYQDHTTSCASSISQMATLAALTGPQDCLVPMRQAFAERREILLGLLSKHPSLRFSAPQGAFYIFVNVEKDLRPGEDDNALCERILDSAHVACVPGTPFGAPGHIRISYALSTPRIQEGMARIFKALEH